MTENIKPDWTPNEAGDEFTSYYMKGINLDQVQNNKILKKRNSLSIDELYNGIIENNISILSRAITLIESNSDFHISQTQELIKKLLPKSGKSIRIGISGPPGAGKSTFIESLGIFLIKNGLKVAVLAIDPSSTVSKGSILGDKTRMELLSREKNAFIRPSPSSGTLGGVARKTRETIIACEAAGYEVILIETIGVGQSEITVRSMVDLFLLMLLPGSGDELQGIKKGVVEIADLLVVNKAEGNNLARANQTKSAYFNALQLLMPATEGWRTEVMTCSAINHTGIDSIWTKINEFIINTQASKVFEKRRSQQLLDWVYSLVDEAIIERFYHNPIIKSMIPDLNHKVLKGEITPTNAVQELLSKGF